MNQCYSLNMIKVIIFFDPKFNLPTENFPTILTYSPTYFIKKCKSYKVLKQYGLAWLVNFWTSFQLQVGKWMKSSICPQCMTSCKMNYRCLQCAHLPQSPKELAIILVKSIHVQVGKFPIVTSYCLTGWVNPKVIL
jgi:hypothetical protein